MKFGPDRQHALDEDAFEIIMAWGDQAEWFVQNNIDKARQRMNVQAAKTWEEILKIVVEATKGKRRSAPRSRNPLPLQR